MPRPPPPTNRFVSGLLTPETNRILVSHRPHPPLMTNGEGQAFTEAHTLGDLRVLPTTDGKYIVFRTGQPNARGRVSGPFRTVAEADAAMRRLAGKPPTPGV